MTRAVAELTSDLKHPAAWVYEALGGMSESSSGVPVTDRTAMSSSAVLCAMRNISEGIGQMPIVLKSVDRPEQGSAHATGEPLYRLLRYSLNSEGLTPMDWLSWMVNSMMVYGNAYNEIERDHLGDVVGIWPLHTTRMSVMRAPKTRERAYIYAPENSTAGPVALRQRDVLHFRGYYTGGLLGLSLKDLGRNAIGLAIAEEQYGGAFFKNGATMSGFVKYPTTLDEAARDRVMAGFAKQKGLNGAQRVAILDEGMEWQNAGISPSDAQMIEQRRFQVAEVCRVFNITPHRLHELSFATYSNVEHLDLDFYKHTLAPWVVRIEQEMLISLIPQEDWPNYTISFDFAALLRADTNAQTEQQAKLRSAGVMSVNEIRDQLGLNPIGPQGDVYTVPLNVQNAALLVTGDEPEPEPTVEGDPQTKGRLETEGLRLEERAHRAAASAAYRLKLRGVYKPLIAREAQRMVRAEIREIRKILQKHLGRDATTLEQALRDWFEGPGRELMRNIIEPILRQYAGDIAEAAADEHGEAAPDVDAFVDAYVDSMVARTAGSHDAQLEQIARESEQPENDLEQRLDEWDETQGEKIGDRETVQLGDAVARTVWVLIGLTLFRWVANAGACPLCQQLDGAVVGVDMAFVQEGGSVEAEGATTLVSKGNVLHPPLHRACQCTIVAEG